VLIIMRVLSASALVAIVELGTLGAQVSVPAPGVPTAHHVLSVRLDPARHFLAATDTVTWSGGAPPSDLSFELNGQLRITSAAPAVVALPREAG
jgi:hypothetical protein